MCASKRDRNCWKRTPFRLAAGLLIAAAIVPVPAASQPRDTPGESKASAIEVCRPAGQRAYLSRLVCPGGAGPEYRRVGNVGNRTDIPQSANNLSTEEKKALLDRILGKAGLQPGEPDYHVVDLYEINCGAEKRQLHMDMYHCDVPPPGEAPPGLTLRPEK